MFRTFTLPLMAAYALSLSATSALADESGLVQIDVVDGWAQADGHRFAGLRIRVAEGWKTYWRAPGDAGVPPHFDWSGSQNLASVTIHWPRPHVFDSFGQKTLGYKGEVVLPIELVPVDPSLPIQVSGQADLGVCRDICVAVQEQVTEVATDGSAAIRASLQAAPEPAVQSAVCRVEPISDGLRLTATLLVPQHGAQEVTVVELPSNDIWISAPIMDRQGGALTVEADLVPPSAQPFDLDTSTVKITVLGEDAATETLGCQAAG